MSVFKKVIGQDVSEPVRPPVPGIPETRRPLDPVTPAAPAAPAYGSPAPAPASAARPSATRNVLSTDVEIKGTVKFTNDLVVDGRIEGEITSDGNLTVGENAVIKAEIHTGTIVVYGKVHGNLTAADRVDLKASAEVIGDIKARTLSIEAGAIFVGKSTVGAPALAPAKAENPAAASGKPAAPKAAAADGQAKQGTLPVVASA